MENEITKYRDKHADLQLSEYCKYDNHCHDCECGSLEQGFIDGFDAAIELDLPVKFAEWKDENAITNNKTMLLVNNIPTYLYKFDGKMWDLKKLYQYWIDNIYKPE